ncbi:uncharacterized protein [Triticum aestivum]|uniref:uncharacterized protein n=1 Tax=Triticum aestivum TaxID=4565 RepID=UPI001D01E649|nr:uncharacterized protein LOC123185375 [Triticum aestivum]
MSPVAPSPSSVFPSLCISSLPRRCLRAENSSPAFPASSKWGFSASPPGSNHLRVIRAANPATLAPGSSRRCPPDLRLFRDPAEAAPSSIAALYRCVQLIQWLPSASFVPASARVCARAARLGAPGSFRLPSQPRARIAMAAGLCFPASLSHLCQILLGSCGMLQTGLCVFFSSSSEISFIPGIFYFVKKKPKLHAFNISPTVHPN